MHTTKYKKAMSKIYCSEAGKKRAHDFRPMSNESSDLMYKDGHNLDPSSSNVPEMRLDRDMDIGV